MAAVGGRRKRPLHIGLVLAFVAGLVAAPTAPAAAHCGSTTPISFITFHVEWEPARKTYRIGETARIKVNVTRPAEEDPLGEGIPTPRPVSFPAEDVRIGIGVVIGDVFTWGSGRTDENGDATVPVPIPEWTSPGWAHARGLAENLVAEVASCFYVYEHGKKAETRFFRVTR